MIDKIIAASYSIILHLALLGLVVLGMDSSSKPHVIAQPKVEIVQATVMDEAKVLEQMMRLQEIDDQKRQQEQDRQTQVDDKLLASQQELEKKQKQAKLDQAKRELEAKKEQQRIDQLIEKRKIEDDKKVEAQKQRKVEEEKQRIAEKQRLVAEELKQQADKKRREAQEKQRLAEADRKAEESRKLEAEKQRKVEEARQQEAEKQRKAEEEKQRKAEQVRKVEADKQRKIEAEKQRKVEQARKLKAERDAQRAEANMLLQQSLATEQQEQEQRRVDGVVNQHVERIRQKIKRYWIRPANTDPGLLSTIKVSLIPSGDVKQVQIIKSSGHDLFDRSVQSAVYKAAPFVMPTDAKAAAILRNFQLVFRPE